MKFPTLYSSGIKAKITLLEKAGNTAHFGSRIQRRNGFLSRVCFWLRIVGKFLMLSSKGLFV